MNDSKTPDSEGQPADELQHWEDLVDMIGAEPDPDAFTASDAADESPPTEKPSKKKQGEPLRGSNTTAEPNHWNSVHGELGLEADLPELLDPEVEQAASTADEAVPQETFPIDEPPVAAELASENLDPLQDLFTDTPPDSFWDNDFTSVKTEAKESTESEDAPAKSAPSQSAPSQSAPSQSAPSQSAPSQSAPSQSAPSQSAPSQSAPSVPSSDGPEGDSTDDEPRRGRRRRGRRRRGGRSDGESIREDRGDDDDAAEPKIASLDDEIADEVTDDDGVASWDEETPEIDRPKEESSRRGRRGGSGRGRRRRSGSDEEAVSGSDEENPKDRDDETDERASRGRRRPRRSANQETARAQDDEGDERSERTAKSRQVPSWQDAVNVIVDGNLAARGGSSRGGGRSRGRSSGRGGGSGGSGSSSSRGGRRRRGSGNRDRDPD